LGVSEVESDDTPGETIEEESDIESDENNLGQDLRKSKNTGYRDPKEYASKNISTFHPSHRKISVLANVHGKKPDFNKRSTIGLGVGSGFGFATDSLRRSIRADAMEGDNKQIKNDRLSILKNLSKAFEDLKERDRRSSVNFGNLAHKNSPHSLVVPGNEFTSLANTSHLSSGHNLHGSHDSSQFVTKDVLSIRRRSQHIKNVESMMDTRDFNRETLEKYSRQDHAENDPDLRRRRRLAMIAAQIPIWGKVSPKIVRSPKNMFEKEKFILPVQIEDLVIGDYKAALFGIITGHGLEKGFLVSLAHKQLIEFLPFYLQSKKTFSEKSVRNTLERAVMQVHKIFVSTCYLEAYKSGVTLCMCLIVNGIAFTVNVGGEGAILICENQNMGSLVSGALGLASKTDKLSHNRFKFKDLCGRHDMNNIEEISRIN
jgi:hypothetical protein